METLFSEFADWDSTSFSFETCQRSRDLKIDDKCIFVSQSITRNQTASTEFGQMNLINKEKINIGAVFLLGNMLCDLCESQLSVKRESKEGNEA